jgi:structural maintenance of chromosome 2
MCHATLQDGNTAKKVAFAREVSARCVSLEGDDYNPGGLLTGGARNTSNPLLARLAALAEAEQQLEQHQQALQQAEQQLQASSAAGTQYKK